MVESYSSHSRVIWLVLSRFLVEVRESSKEEAERDHEWVEVDLQWENV